MSENTYKPQMQVLTHELDLDGHWWLTVIIIDNGIGWSWEQMPERTWERYHHNQRLVERLGGTYEYYARYGRGSLVIIRLPVKDHQTSQLYRDWFSLMALITMLMYYYNKNQEDSLSLRKRS